MNLITEIARVGLKIMFHSKYKFTFKYTDFNPKRKEPYFLIFNHTELLDPLFVGMPLKHYPYPVASNVVYSNKFMKFGLTKLVKSIPKRKGQPDSRTIRMILDAFNNDKRGIMIAPEGNSSFYGNETPTDYIATAKLVKKINKDLIVAHIDGGFFASPRWGKSRKGAHIELEYYPLIKEGEYEDLSVEEIAKKMEMAIKFNDYEWIKNKPYIYKQHDLAEGLENVIYACPKCENIHTISTKGNHVICSNCGTIASFDHKHHLTGKFDNLVEWNIYQKELLKKFAKGKYVTDTKLHMLEFNKDLRIFKGDFEATLNGHQLLLKNEALNYTFDLNELKGIALTQKNNISFDYQDEVYFLTIKDPMLFLDLILYKKGEN